MIRALKNEQKDEVERVRPKSVINTLGTASDTYGQIPNLRSSVDQRHPFMPMKNSLSKFERLAYQTQSPQKDFLDSGRQGAEVGAMTAASWDPRNSAGGSAGISADAGSVSNQPTAVILPESDKQANFRIRNSRRRRKPRKGSSSMRKRSPNMNPVSEYGYVTA